MVIRCLELCGIMRFFSDFDICKVDVIYCMIGRVVIVFSRNLI